jgi:spore maturation protein CgeB
MKILYVAAKYDYGKYERGLSFEHFNFYDTFFNMGNQIIYFDYMEILKKVGKARMNRLLLDTVHTEKPELMFVFLLEYELDPRIISQISKSGKVITLNWFADDHWRFENYSRYWARNFNWVVTTDFEAIPKYQSIGYSNAILSQWACNHFLYKNFDLNPEYDVSFVGQAYGNRRRIIDTVEKTGIRVLEKGQGWESGRINQKEMIDIFNQSKVNLNLSNASVKYASSWVAYIDRFALYTPGTRRIWRKLRTMIPLSLSKAQTISQIKGRNFEIPGCGGFLITDYVKELEEFYLPDRDIVCYNSLDELIEKIQYYLEHENLRKEIAFNGWKTTHERHTYVHRFNCIFEKIGFNLHFSLDQKPGDCVEVSEGLR